MKKIILTLSIAALGFSNFAIAEPSKKADFKAEQKMADDDSDDIPKKKKSRLDRVICKKEMITGTRLKKIVTCRTIREWREIERGAFKSTGDVVDKAQPSVQSKG